MTNVDLTTYYKFREPVNQSRPANADVVAYSHLGFLVVRASDDHVLWKITNANGTSPPLPLQSQFTKRSMAEERIAEFLASEQMKQQSI